MGSSLVLKQTMPKPPKGGFWKLSTSVFRGVNAWAREIFFSATPISMIKLLSSAFFRTLLRRHRLLLLVALRRRLLASTARSSALLTRPAPVLYPPRRRKSCDDSNFDQVAPQALVLAVQP